LFGKERIFIMKVVTTIAELREARAHLPEPVGLVPTMGYLHQGHISLVNSARQQCKSVVVSIFVNPSQFGPTEDLEKYPRSLQHDLALLEEAGVNLVWAPAAEEMYPPSFQTWVTVTELSTPLEGALRPTHFRGVATIVCKLFNAVQPQRAYFGQKDAQQALVIRRMVLDLNFPIEIVVCPIAREDDGLAMSSRNTYLNQEQRQLATTLHRALSTAQQVHLKGENNAEALRRVIRNILEEVPQIGIQYIACADPETLQELEKVSEKALLLVAVALGKTRLIDNLLIP
jgi:pantoate--beta-alanine ligase